MRCRRLRSVTLRREEHDLRIGRQMRQRHEEAIELAVHDNERVRQGQVRFRIDPEPYQIAFEQAEARLGSAR